MAMPFATLDVHNLMVDLMRASKYNTFLCDCAPAMQAYQGLRTADKLKEQYIFIPNKVKEVYLTHLLERLSDLKAG
jgi:hypothetical protein